MRKDLIPTQEEFNEMDKAEQITTLCTVHECNAKVRKLHHAAYVFGQWNPHPPQRFLAWWSKDGVEQTEENTGRPWAGVGAVQAFNCQAVREVYREAKTYGLA